MFVKYIKKFQWILYPGRPTPLSSLLGPQVSGTDIRSVVIIYQPTGTLSLSRRPKVKGVLTVLTKPRPMKIIRYVEVLRCWLIKSNSLNMDLNYLWLGHGYIRSIIIFVKCFINYYIIKIISYLAYTPS